MIGKPRDRLVAIAPGGNAPEGHDDSVAAEMWLRLCTAGDRYRQGDTGTWEVLVAASDFVRVSGDSAKAVRFMSTLPRPATR